VVAMYLSARGHFGQLSGRGGFVILPPGEGAVDWAGTGRQPMTARQGAG